jgi:radical SAM superfamily enzyme YgiQ (UPF0313 family)
VRFLLIYPSWPKLNRQTTFHLPPHGPAVMAAEIPSWVEVTFIDENVEELPADLSGWDLAGVSMMLTAQLPRAFAIMDACREAGLAVLAGGIAAMLHESEVMSHCTSLFYGEVEGRLDAVFHDAARGRLKALYDYRGDFPPISSVGPARRSILKPELYAHKRVRMADLFHASRGCRFHCFPCCTAFLGGRQFRPRPMDRVVEEMATIDNDRLFIVDNSLAQDKKWELELFRAIAPFNKAWCCHPIEDDDEVVAAAAEAGAWYVYQAIFDTSDHIRDRIKRYKRYGIGVEGTIILGVDEHDEDSIKRLVDFLLEVDLDLAEFTILTPFAHTPIRQAMESQGRILTNDPSRYTADTVVFKPKRMSPAALQDMYHYAWDAFYADEPQSYKMYKLFRKLSARESSGEARGRGRSL